jgi:hydrogenase-4 component F
MIIVYFILVIILSFCLFVFRNKTVSYFLLAIFIVLQWVFTIYEYKHLGSADALYFTSDPLSIVFLLVLGVICIPAFYHSAVYLNAYNDAPRERGIYFAAMIILLASLSAAYLSNHIGITWVFVELTTLSASALIYHRRNSRTLEATWKYVFVCSISITLVFIGILFVSIATQREGFSDLSYSGLFKNAEILNVFWLKLAFLFIFSGFTAKAGLVPMYTAGIDAKDKAPSPAGALLATVLINVGFIGIFRFYLIIGQTSVFEWAKNVLMLSGFLSVFISAVYILRVKNFKRMLAYSGVEHMGLVMLGLAAGGIGYYAAVLHLILHSFAKSMMFFQFHQIYRIYQSKSIYDIGNYFSYNLPGALVLLFGYFIISAMPPSGMFVSEFFIFKSIFESGNFWLLAVILLLLTLIIWAQGKNIFKMLFIKPIAFKEENIKRIDGIESLSQYILLALVIYLGFNPPVEMINLINDSVKSLP